MSQVDLLDESCEEMEAQAIAGIALVYKEMGKTEVAAIFFQVSANMFSSLKQYRHYENCVLETLLLYTRSDHHDLAVKYIEEEKVKGGKFSPPMMYKIEQILAGVPEHALLGSRACPASPTEATRKKQNRSCSLQ